MNQPLRPESVLGNRLMKRGHGDLTTSDQDRRREALEQTQANPGGCSFGPGGSLQSITGSRGQALPDTMRGTMNRDHLAAAAPGWLAIEKIPAHAQLHMIANWVESILDAVAQDHVEPDAWETLQLSRAIGSLLEGNYFAALSFGELSLNDPARHRAIRLGPVGTGSVTLTDLRDAMKLIRGQRL